MSERKKVSVQNMLAYGSGDLYGGGSFFIIGALFLIFLTDVAKISPVNAGLIIMVGKIWDAVTDPAMGYISDHTRSKHGRRRLYFLIGILPIFISFSLLWLSFQGPEWVKVIYYIFTYLLFNTVFTMVMVPYNSMPSEMSSEYKERSNMISVRMAFSQFGALTGAVLPRTIIGSFENEATGYIVMAIFFAIIYTLPWIFVYKGTWESGKATISNEKKSFSEVTKELISEFSSTFRNKALKIQIIMYLCAYVTMDIFNALFPYFVRDYLNKMYAYQIILGTVVLVQMLTLILVAKECSKVGNAKTYRRHLSIWLFGILSMGILTNSNTPLAFLIVIAVIVGIGLCGGVMIPYNMLAFVVDADEIITRRRREGTYAGMMTFIRKIAQALAIFLVGVSLQAFGYSGQDVTVNQTVVQGIRILFLTVPFILILTSIFFSFRFKITPTNHKILLSENERLKANGEKELVSQKNKEVVEQITGINYCDLWKELK